MVYNQGMRSFHALIFFVLCLFAHPVFADMDMAPGFVLKKFASVPGARSLAVASELGAIFVGTRSNSIYAILDENKDGKADSVRLLSDKLNVPNGVAWKEGALYVAEQHRLTRYVIGNKLPHVWPEPEILYDGFPNKRWHGWRYMAFGPDGGLYVSIGAPCNVCMPSGYEGTILRFEPDIWIPVVFAKGIRNSVGFDFDLINGDMLFSDNGADHMGDDLPSDELNRAPLGGLHFGFPYFGGGSARTKDFKDLSVDLPHRSPAWEFQAHVAPLGVHLYRGDRFPKPYKDGVFVALHGSWNRTEPVGYQISFLAFDKKGVIKTEIPFIKGWLERDGEVLARPVDMAEWNDGQLLISDDEGDAVYIVDYHQ